MFRHFRPRSQQTAANPPVRNGNAPPDTQTEAPDQLSSSVEPPWVFDFAFQDSPLPAIPRSEVSPFARTGDDVRTTTVLPATESAGHGSSGNPVFGAVQLPQQERLPDSKSQTPSLGLPTDAAPAPVTHSFVGGNSSVRPSWPLASQGDASRSIGTDQAASVVASKPATVPPHEMEKADRVKEYSSRAIESLAPPVSTIPMASPRVDKMPRMVVEKQSGIEATAAAVDTAETEEAPPFYDVDKPTCSLNLVCYRSGAHGCDLQQVQCVLRSSFPSNASFETVVEGNPNLVYADDEFFREIRRLYETQMCGFFRRYFSLKTLRAFRVLAYTPTTRPTVVPFDDFVLQEMMYAYRNPDRLSSTDDWVQWVFRLRRKDRRHALEFVEGWNTARIAISGTVPWLASCLVAIIWTAMGGDPQTTFTVASFILTSSSIILALLAIVSSIESSGSLSR